MNKSVLMVPVILAVLALPIGVFADEHLAATKAPGEEAAAPQQEQKQGGDHAGYQHGSGHTGHGEAAGPSKSHLGMMMEKCKEMMAKRAEMEEQMKAMDARLEEKVAAMNTAKAEQKMEAMAAVITELASQRKEMREKMGHMRHGNMCMMMCPMMGHGGMGAMDCPMMKEHGGRQPQSGGGAPEKKGEAS